MRISRRQAIFGLTAAGLAGSSASSATASRAGTAFGTTVRLTISAASPAQAENCIDAGFAEIRKVEKAFSLFDASSELCRLNTARRLRNPSTLFVELAQRADAIWRTTGGAFDPTVQKLWEVWATGEGETSSRLLPEIGFQHVEISNTEVRLNTRAALTFNGIAQGYASDLVAKAIAPLGAFSAVLDTGEFGLIGGNTSDFAIAHPRKPNTALGFLKVAQGFVATSGDYASAFTPDFLHHHIFDPATGTSPAELASVTVVASSGAKADGLATAFMVMGVEKVRAFIAQNPDVSAILVTKRLAISAFNIKDHDFLIT